MQILHKFNKTKGLYLELNGQVKAEMTVSMTNKHKMIIEHTEVDPSLKGQGIGYELVEASVHYARDNQLKIKPMCPFAHAVFKKKQEAYADVLSQ